MEGHPDKVTPLYQLGLARVERGGLQGLARRFVRHRVRSESAQLVKDQRQEFLDGLCIQFSTITGES